MTLKLYETVDALAVVRAWMDEHDDEIRANEGALPNELAALLEQAEGDFKTKVERVALLVRELEHLGEIAKAEKDRLGARQKSREVQAKRLKDFYLKGQLVLAKETRVECRLLTVRIQKNSTPSVKHTRTAEQLWAAKSPYAIKLVTTHHRHGQDPSELITYAFDNETIVADHKAKHVSDAQLAEMGITVETGNHVRIA